MSRTDISAGWSDEDWQDAATDLAPLSASEPQPGQASPSEHWDWFGSDGRSAAWRAFGEES